MTPAAIVPLPVLLPLLGAGLALVLHRFRRVQRIISLTCLSLLVVVAVALLMAADQAPVVAQIGGWAPPVGIVLVADRFSALLLLVSATILLCVLVYAMAQGMADSDVSGDDAEQLDVLPIAVYHPTFLVLAAGVNGAFLAGDLFNLYVGFEVLLAASYVLLTLGGTADRIRSGAVYVVVALVSSVVFLFGITLAYAATGTVNLADLAVRLADVDPGVRLAIQLMLLLGFGIKAAVFPLSAWLPDSYPTAPAPVTAVFAGLLTKVGIYAIIRTQTLLFPPHGAGSPWISQVLLVLATLTMVVGILGAVAQDDIKRLLSFTLVSHIGYLVVGVAVAGDAGTAGAIFYAVHHITVQTALFLVVGLVQRCGGTTSLDRLGGLAKLMPGLAILFFVPAMNLAGIPPFSGFLGKVAILQAGVRDGSPLAWLAVVASVATSLLTLYALIKAWNKAFWQPVPAESGEGFAGEGFGGEAAAGEAAVGVVPASALPFGMVAAAGALVAVSLAITALAGPLYAFAHRAALALTDVTYYVSAVLG